LTDAGRFLMKRSEELLAGAAALERDMREFSAAAAGSLHVGATVTIGTHGLAPLLRRFGESHPRIEVRIAIGNTESTVAEVRAGRLALALIEGAVSGDDIEAIPYATDELVLIVPTGHRLARRTSISAQELHGERFIMRESGSGTRRLVEAALGRAGVVPNNVLELPSGDAIGRAVESGLGISIVSRLVIERDVALGRLHIVRVRDVDLHRPFLLVRSLAYTPSPAARAFASIVSGDERAGK
jgi:DNA-binding transcriptional LysR family regulator